MKKTFNYRFSDSERTCWRINVVEGERINHLVEPNDPPFFETEWHIAILNKDLNTYIPVSICFTTQYDTPPSELDVAYAVSRWFNRWSVEMVAGINTIKQDS